ncbi:MAG: hypothetical protein CSA26_03285 [Desulfobacterales bacterium]|nr:MAG: hypothetical protein CSA26_03285 [Desulfobacterales bacterium]
MADFTTQQVQPQMNYQQPVQPVFQQAVQPTVPSQSVLGLNVQDSQFWKGALIGAAVALLVTNESVQKGVVKTVSKLSAAAQSGIEEMKEKFEDAKAEVQAEAESSRSAE